MIDDESGPHLAYQLVQPAADGRLPVDKAKVNGHAAVALWLEDASARHGLLKL